MPDIIATDGPSDDQDGDRYRAQHVSIGLKIRAARQGQYTARELAERAGLSLGLISSLERGVANPSLANILKVAHALDIPLAYLLDGSGTDDVVVVRANERRTLGMARENHTIQLLSPLKRSFAVTRTMLPAGYQGSGRPYHKEADLFFHVLSGAVVAVIGDAEYPLETGDSIYFDSRGLVSRLTNPYSTVAEVISCISPPEF